VTQERVFTPTHNCFDDVADFLAHAIARGDLSKYLIVHGSCRGVDVLKYGNDRVPLEQVVYAHAWLIDQTDGYVIDLAHDSEAKDVVALKIHPAEFLQHRRVIDQVIYTPREAALASAISGGSGPWRYYLRRLCGDKPNPRVHSRTARLGTYSKIERGAS
jgi:hypothetical protein